MKRIAITLGLLMGQSLAASAFEWPWTRATEAEAPAPRPVVTLIVHDHPLTERSVPGVIAARIEVDLGFQTLGRIVSRDVDIGDSVQEGQVLAAIDPDDLQGDVTAADAAVAAAKVQFETAKATAQRTRELANKDVVSTAVLERAEKALVAAEAAYSQSQSELIRARDAEGYAKMIAPFSGVITEVFASAGAVASAGQPVLRLSADKQLEAVIDLPQEAIADVLPHAHYEVWSDSNPTEVLPASVRLIQPEADLATRTRRVHLLLEDKGHMRIGALIRARPVAANGASLTVPISAITRRNNQPYVWLVLEKDGQRQVNLQAVKTEGPVLDSRVMVTDGIKEGDEIVTRGANSLTEGQAVGRGVQP